MMYAPFTVQNAGQPPANISPPGLGDKAMTEERLRRRQRLLYAVEDPFNEGAFPHLRSTKPRGTPEQRRLADAEEASMREAAGSPAQAHASVYSKAFDLTVSRLRNIFDLSREPASKITEFGGRNNRFGMGTLLASKLVQEGVTTVEVDLGGWDNHAGIFNTIRTRSGPQLDRGISGLVNDLQRTDKLKNTVIVWMGEFGRTPRINQNGGRDHWARCWSVMIGGGAIKGGQVYGATDADGVNVKDDPATIGDLFATIYKGLGLDPGTKVRDNLGRPLEIAEGKPLRGLV
jgi:uncharacterized protein (DUF1501 family)